MRIKKLAKGLSLSGLVLLPLLTVAPVVQAEEGAIELINRMNRSLRELNYTGSLAYLRGNSLSTLNIEHRVVNGVETERVVRLNEKGGEVTRELTGFSLSSLPKISPEMLRVYSFDKGRTNRIANIKCRVITARPKDRNRYLQKYCIDEVTGMLLDFMLVDKSHKPVEQLMFTNIQIERAERELADEKGNNKVSGAISDVGLTSIVAPGSPGTAAQKALVQPEQSLKGGGFQPISNLNLDDGWVIEALPVGFEIKAVPTPDQPVGGDVDSTKHYVVSDGLSSLSVFVSPLTEESLSSAVKVNSGALNVVSQEKDGHLVTVVGEVPEITLKNIVKSLQKK